ncbi:MULTISPECIES: lysozyme inhibitor LprI family protein [Rhizobium]|uniref:Lysozyme inhibitor LprI family protein n=1 Tax=Rhizobium rhododendri TaxID=2506430 RepID=A0ABY8IRX7_9HYPH|nr:MULTISPECIES: lysozyme inhibitor LprI family protein [Rhizobium]WFS25957.1 lysozyme inhibitor LprI family protein [Rhizobium rhododendri]
MTAFLTMGASSSAWAINCDKAVAPIDKRICGNAGLKAADAAMGQAYGVILKAAPDSEIRKMLTDSQRRWIAARDDGLSANSEGAPLPISELQKAFAERTSRLKDRTDKGLIAQAAAQRRFLAKYTGGSFTGFETNCEFIPNDSGGTSFSYQCFGAMHVQQNYRVCSARTDWATWSLSEYHGVSAVKGDVAKLSAICGDQSGNICNSGDGRDEDSTWKLHPERDERLLSPKSNLTKLDVEGVWPLEDSDVNWFDQCLTNAIFPPAQ